MTAAVCASLGVSRATVQRQRARLSALPAIARPRPRPARALTRPQRREVLDLLHAPRFADQAPAEIYATLLDEGVYHCSIRTIYRILEQNGEVHERRQQLRHPVYQKPELLAERANEVWSWDITKLMGPAKWSYFYLYVILDIFSRRVVGWCVVDAESATLFRPLFDDAIVKHNVPPGQLTLHADRGSPMKAKATAFLLADLGVTRSHNRPHTSNDNPFSERTAFFAWRRGAQASPRELDSWIRAGERKTCWAKPPLVPPRLWALNGVGSFADASSEHSEQWLEGPDRDSRAFGPSSQPGLGRLARGRGPRWLSLHKRPHSDLAGNSASCGWSYAGILGHDVSGTGWQILGRAMQSIITMVPIWQ